MTRFYGLDVHRDFAQIAMCTDGVVVDVGQVDCRPGALREWASAAVSAEDQVCLEATGNSEAIARLLGEFAGRVVVSNPLKTRAIAEAKVKTDKVDARILAQLLAADFLPGVWLADERIAMLRRLVSQRSNLVRSRTAVKNQVHAVLARNLLPRPEATDLFGKAGRAWLGRQLLAADEERLVASLLRQLDFLSAELAAVEQEVASSVLDDPVAARLMTIPGVSIIVAVGIIAAVGDFARFASGDKLVWILRSLGAIVPLGTEPLFRFSLSHCSVGC